MGKKRAVIALVSLLSFIGLGGGVMALLKLRSQNLQKLILPPKLYALEEQELNIYFDNIVMGRDTDYDFEVFCPAGGQQWEHCYRLIPTEPGWYDITINAYQGGKKVASTTSTIIISDADAGDNVNRKVLVIGDSTTADGICMGKLLTNFNEDAMDITLLGTKGNAPNLHEGISGWTIDMYYSLSEFDGTKNAFWNPDTEKFDFSYYMNEQGYLDVDYVILNLGINDIFGVSYYTSSKDDVEKKINTMISQYHEMIESIHQFDANIKIGLAITIPPSYSQDAFGKNYGTVYSRWRYREHYFLWCKRLIEEFKDKEKDGVFLVPVYTNLDTQYNMGIEYVQANARSPETIETTIANGSVHPNEFGYWQIADVYWFFLKSFER